jgi:hypothetical protein
MSAALRKLCAVPTSSPPETPDGAEAEAADTQPICLALVIQGAGAAAGADNEVCLDDRKVDGAGVSLGRSALRAAGIAESISAKG